VVFRFGDHVLDIERRELCRGAEPVALEPQVFDLLVYLVRNRGRVVSKDDLIEGVWGGRIVSDSALTTRLNAVRKAVNDSGAEQRLIRTVPRRGVRFVAEVSEDHEPTAPAAADSPIAPRLSIVVLPFVYGQSGSKATPAICSPGKTRLPTGSRLRSTSSSSTPQPPGRASAPTRAITFCAGARYG